MRWYEDGNADLGNHRSDSSAVYLSNSNSSSLIFYYIFIGLSRSHHVEPPENMRIRRNWQFDKFYYQTAAGRLSQKPQWWNQLRIEWAMAFPMKLFSWFRDVTHKTFDNIVFDQTCLEFLEWKSNVATAKERMNFQLRNLFCAINEILSTKAFPHFKEKFFRLRVINSICIAKDNELKESLKSNISAGIACNAIISERSSSLPNDFIITWRKGERQKIMA